MSSNNSGSQVVGGILTLLIMMGVKSCIRGNYQPNTTYQYESPSRVEPCGYSECPTPSFRY